jgi:GTP-binding protein
METDMSSRARFVKSAFEPKDYPESKLPEVVITGRSNAGKSSLINAWTGSKVAKISQTPGKTRLINFFDFGNYMLVDLPGYGYASRSGGEVQSYQTMIESYFSLRSQVACLILVMDINRNWTQDEELLRIFANTIGKPMAVAVTKVDKLNQKEKAQRRKALSEQIKSRDVFLISSTQRVGVDELEESVYRQYVLKKD